MEENIKRVASRLDDCQVILVGDRWKENYKEDVHMLVKYIQQLEPQCLVLQQATQEQTNVINYLGMMMDQITLRPDEAAALAEEALKALFPEESLPSPDGDFMQEDVREFEDVQ